MKKYIKYTYILMMCGAMFISSCSKWLDVKPQTSVESGDLLNSEDGFKEALIGVYIGMSSPNSYGRELSFGFVDVLSCQYEVPSGQEYYNTQLYNFKATNTISKKDKIWETQYNSIVNVNNALNNIDAKKSIMSPVIFSIIKGELLGLRAFLHLDLMRLYGYGDLKNRPEMMNRLTIPYSKNYSKDFIPQNTHRETIKLIEADLLEAIEYLKIDPVIEDEDRDPNFYKEFNTDGFLDKRNDRFNYWAANATLARLYYWIGDYTNALKYANAVIENASWGWVSEAAISNSDISKRDLTFSVEHLFSLRATKYGDIANRYFLFSSNSTSTSQMLYRSEDNAKNLYEINTPIGVSDYRFNYLYVTADKKSFPVKFAQYDEASEGYKGRIPLIKISEMFIIAIDAMINGNNPDLTKSIEYFTRLRKARGIKVLFPEDSNAEFLNNELLKEIQKEFICEGQLFYFYKRMNCEKLPYTTEQMNDKKYVVPYPDDEIIYGNRVQ